MTAVQVGTPARSDSSEPLMRAVLAISGDLELRSVLERVVEAAVELTDARYGALGVAGRDGQLSEFVTTGLPRPPMGSSLGVPIRVRGTVFGNLYLTDKRSGPFAETDEQLVLALARAAALVIDNARTYGLSERRRQWLEAAAELADALEPPVALAGALQEVVVKARRTAGARLAVIVQIPEASHPVIAAADGGSGGLPDLVRAVIDQVRVADSQAVAVDVDLGDRVARVIPLRAHLSDPGALVVVLSPDAAADHEEREMLAGFVDQAGLALDRTQAFADREELAVVRERARIARDLHDVVIQRLFAAGLKSQAARSRDGLSGERLDAFVDDLVDDLDATIKDIRTTIFGLSHVARRSLRAAVVDLVDEYTQVFGFRPVLRTNGALDLLVPEPVAENLLAVLREALSNIARHSRARSASVVVRATDDAVTLEVTDSGTGIPVQRSESGLRNARERAAGLGGTLEVAPSAGQGTTLRWACPLAAEG